MSPEIEGVGLSPAAHGLAADDDRLRLPTGLSPDTTYDVLLNGRHVWSLQPGRDTRPAEEGPVAPWPKALRRYLRGRAEVALRDHVSGAVLASAHHTFGGDAGREVTVTDSAGNALVLDKWGRLIRPLSAEDGSTIDELLDAVQHLLAVLHDDAGVPAYICYGTLLGAVRNGELIGHDNDIDLAYVSEHAYPVDVVREGFGVERALRDAGYLVRRGSGARLNVRLRMSDGSLRFIDVFTSHWVEGVLYIPSDTGFRLPRETLLPLSTVTLHGREVPAPADPERLLAATYGPGWRVPDPSFKYVTPRRLSRRLGGWFGGLKSHRKYWDAFNVRAQREVPSEPSLFAQWVAEEYPSDRPLLDVGTGNARDALFFARGDRQVVGIDYSVGAVQRAGAASREQGLPASFEAVSLYDTRAVLALGARLSRSDAPYDVYVRFTLNALDFLGRQNVLRLASMSLRRGGYLFLEFRTPRDRRRPHAFGEHLRRYLRPATVAAQIEAAGGRVVHQVEGTGLAPFRDEDPYLCRIVASWSELPAEVTP